MSDFGALLRRLVDDRYTSRRAFVRAAQPGADENGAQGYLSRVISGKKPAPIALLTAWADALDLSGDDRDRFMDLAVKSHASDAVLALIGRLERENARLRRDLSAAASATPHAADDPMRELRSIMDPDEQPPSDPPTHPRPVALPGGARRDG